MARKRSFITFKFKLKNFFIIIFLCALIFALLSAFVSFKLYLGTSKNPSDRFNQPAPAIPSPPPDEIKELLLKIGKHMHLPEGIPSVITVTSVDQLKKDQPFFANAQNGHKLLVYQNKVIIYDPQKDLIVDIAYIRQAETPSVSPASSILSPTPPV